MVEIGSGEVERRKHKYIPKKEDIYAFFEILDCLPLVQSNYKSLPCMAISSINTITCIFMILQIHQYILKSTGILTSNKIIFKTLSSSVLEMK